MNSNIIADALEYVKSVFATDFSGHDYFHTLRVYHMASRIAEAENAQMELVQLAALLHDVDDRKLSPHTCAQKDNARAFLRSHGLAEETVDEIVRIIDEVSYKGTESVAPHSLEGQCVQDADRLDAIGAIGIARAFTFGGHHHRVMYDPAIEPSLALDAEGYRNHVSTTINHFYEKLLRLTALMNTPAAQAIAQEREAYMQDYLARFLEEWDGRK